MNVKKILSNETGFTLIEVLLSLTLLSIVLLGIMSYFNQAYSYTNLNQKKTAGINVARNVLMFLEDENFIEMKKEFLDHPNEPFSLLICSVNGKEQYTKIWNNDTQDSGCHPITVNNLKYEVTIRPTDSPIQEAATKFTIPITVQAEWLINANTYSTKIEGEIKSEDLR